MVRVRRVAFVLLAACGRIGFDGDGAALPDGTPDASSAAALCNAHDVATLELDGTATTLRALATVSGFVVAIGTGNGNIYVARVPETLASAELHLPLAGGYALGGLSAIGDRIYLHARVDGTGYLKLLEPSFDTYATIEAGDDLALDPPTAPRTPGTGWRLNIAAGMLDVQEMATDGTRTGLVASYAPATQTATIAGNRLVTVLGKSCQTVVLSDAATPSRVHDIAGCSDPRLAVLDGGAALIAMRTGPAEWVVYRVPDDGTGGTSRSLGDVSGARIAAADAAAWLVYARGGIVELARFDAALTSSTVALPSVSSPYDIAPNAVFWLAGSTLRVGTPCLR